MDIGTLTGTIALENQMSSVLSLVTDQVKTFSQEFVKNMQASSSEAGVWAGQLVEVAGIAGVAVAAIGGITAAITAMGVRGSDVNTLSSTMDSFTGSVGKSAEIMEAMREGTLNTVSDMDLMKASSKLLSTGALENAGDFKTLTEAAFVLQNRGLGTTTDMMHLLSQALITGKAKALEAQVGFIDLKKGQEEYADSIGKHGEKLDDVAKKEANRITILNAMKNMVSQAGDQERDFGQNIDAAKVQFNNFINDMSGAVAKSGIWSTMFKGWGEAFMEVFGGDKKAMIDTIVSAVEKFASWMTRMGAELVSVALAISEAWSAIETVILGVVTAVITTFDVLIKGWDTANQAAAKLHLIPPETAQDIHNFRVEMDATTKSWQDSTAEAAKGVTGHAAYQEQMKKGRDVLLATADSMDKLAGTTVAATGATQQHTGAVGSGTPKIDEHAKAVQNLIDAWTGHNKSAQLVVEAYNKLTPAQRDSYDVQQALIPVVQKLIDQHQQVPAAMMATYNAGIQARDAMIEEDKAILYLTGTTTDWIKQQKELGHSEAEIAASLGVSVEALRLWDKEVTAANKPLDDYNKKLKAVNDALGDYYASLNPLTKKQQDEIAILHNTTLTVEQIATKVGALPAQVKRVTDSIDADRKAWQTEKDAIDAADKKIQDYYLSLMPLTDEEKDRVENLIKMGLSDKEIAAKIGETAGQVKNYRQEVVEANKATEEAIKKNDEFENAIESFYQSLIPLSDEQQARIKEWNDMGISAEAMANQLRVATGAVQNYLDTLKASSGAVVMDNLAKGFQAIGQAAGGSLGKGMGDIGRIVNMTNESMKNAAANTTHWTEVMDESGSHWEKTSGKFGYMSTMFSSTASGAAKAGAAVGAATSIVGGIQGFQQAFQEKGKGARVWGSAKAGAEIGSIAGPYGAAIGMGVGALIGLFKGDPEWVKAQNALGKELQVSLSDDLSKAIAQTADDMGNMGAAVATHMGDIIKEAGGLTKQNLAGFENRYTYVVQQIKGGQLTIQQGQKIIEDNWDSFAQAGTSAVGVLDKNLTGMVKSLKDVGVESEKIKAYLGQQAAAGAQELGKALTIPAQAILKHQQDVDALAQAYEDLGDAAPNQVDNIQLAIAKLNEDLEVQKDVIGATAVRTQDSADAMAYSITADFNAMIASGMTFSDAVAAVQPTIDALSVQMESAGLTGSDAFILLQQQVELYSSAITGPAMQSVDSLSKSMVNLGNMGQLTQGAFIALSDQIYTTFDNLVKQGYDSNTVMLGMRDSIQRMWEEQQQFGYKTDDSTQALIDQAVAEGIVGEKHKSVSDQMLDATNKMVDVLEAVAKKLGADIPSAADAGAKAVQTSLNAITAPKLTVKINYDDPGPPQHSGETVTNNVSYASTGGLVTSSGVQYLASGGNVVPFEPRGTDTVPAMLTPGERVLSVEQNQNIEQYMEGPSNTEVVGAIEDLRGDMRGLPDRLALSMRDALLKSGKRVA